MTTQFESAKVDLPLPTSANAKTCIQTCNAQSAVIEKCPDYPATPTAQTTVADMDAAVAVLQGTDTQVDQVRAQLRALEKTRSTQIGAVHLKHDAVVTALNAASNNDPEAAKRWTGKTKERAKPAATPAPTGAPANPSLNSVKRYAGSVKARCDEEAGAVGYVYQFGQDPNHPETWASPLIFSKGHTHTLRNQPIGQLLCARIAVVRRGNVQGAWSIVLQITVR